MNLIDPYVTARVRYILNGVYDDLLQVMVDLATPPIFLMSERRHRLVAVRDRAAAVLGEWAALNPEEAEALVSRLPPVLQLRDTVQSLLEGAPWDDYFQRPASIFERPHPGAPVFSALPHLLELTDDDGLLRLDGLDARPHGLFVGDYSLHYHQLLRRSFGANIHYELIGAIIRLGRTEGVEARIALDERRLRRRDEHQESEERDYWRGPPLDESKLDDLNAVGETVHGHPECGRSLLCPYWAVCIRWTRDGPLKTVEIEEFLPVDEEAHDLVLVRYLHAIRDTTQKAFIHCDGAVKAYEAAGYPADLSEFRHRGRGLHYRKVFRLDGELDAEAWSHLTALWFRGNPLVLEYLAGLPGPSS